MLVEPLPGDEYDETDQISSSAKTKPELPASVILSIYNCCRANNRACTCREEVPVEETSLIFRFLVLFAPTDTKVVRVPADPVATRAKVAYRIPSWNVDGDWHKTEPVSHGPGLK